MYFVLKNHSKNSWKHWVGASLGPNALILRQGLKVNVQLTPFHVRNCVMGTSPVPRGINAAALAVATSAVETLREVC